VLDEALMLLRFGVPNR